jgi:toxin ParE1/3/4
LKNLFYAQAAIDDLSSIIDYIALDSPAAAQEVFESIVAAIERLADFPDLGHVGRVPGTRELSITRLPYVVVYQVSATAVTVVAVFHGARDLARAIAERSQGKP